MRGHLIFFICGFLIILMIINVNAEDITGEVVTGEATQQVYMNISVTASNFAPIIGDINSSIYICEGNFLDYAFDMTYFKIAQAGACINVNFLKDYIATDYFCVQAPDKPVGFFTDCFKAVIITINV